MSSDVDSLSTLEAKNAMRISTIFVSLQINCVESLNSPTRPAMVPARFHFVVVPAAASTPASSPASSPLWLVLWVSACILPVAVSRVSGRNMIPVAPRISMRNPAMKGTHGLMVIKYALTGRAMASEMTATAVT